MAKSRPSVLDNPELQGVSFLDDLDSFLDTEEDRVSQQSLPLLDLGESCEECRAGTTPVLSAMTSGHKKCLQEILAAQSELELKTVLADKGETLVHIGSRRGDLDCLRIVLEADASVCDIGDVRGATPLHVCAYHGNLECLKCLLKEGQSKILKDQDGATPVHFAAASGNTSCLKVLIEEGNGDPNEQTYSGETPVYFAAQEGHLDSVHYLIESAKADPNISSNDGMTPLHAAAQTGRLHITHWLVRSAKCPVMCRTCDGATPVHFAATKGHVAILEWMLHHSLANGLECDDFGATPIHDAAEHNQLECLHVFYNHSINLAPRDSDGMTPLDLAREKGNARCVEFLENPEDSLEAAKKQAQDSKKTELKLLLSSAQDNPVASGTSKRRRFSNILSRRKSKTGSSLTTGRKKS